MAQFDVYRLADGFVIDCQSDLIHHYETCFAVPLLAVGEGPSIAKRLNPVFDVGDRQLVMYTQYAAAVPRRVLEEKIASLAADRDRIVAAIDMLVSGF
jgi:toxin CcdB